MLAKVFDAFCSALGSLELWATRGTQYRAAAMNNVGNAPESQFDKVILDKSGIAALDAHNFHTAGNAVTYSRANGRIHAGRVAAASQYCDFFHNHYLFCAPLLFGSATIEFLI